MKYVTITTSFHLLRLITLVYSKKARRSPTSFIHYSSSSSCSTNDIRKSIGIHNRKNNHIQSSNNKNHLSLQVAPSSFLPNNTSNNNNYDNRIQIDESYNGIQKIYSNPDIFIIKNFLDKESCQDLIHSAQQKKLELSPVAYAGKTEDKDELVSLAAKGPVAWLSILVAWYQSQSSSSSADGSDLVQFGIHLLENYASLFALAYVSITAFLGSREEGLQSLRTSTSTTLNNLDDPNSGTTRFVSNAANLFNPNQNDKSNPAKHAQYFESPTVIRYEKDQVLAPHFDANRAASTEDANRGGQTLATLLVYLNDVENGGNTRFGRLIGDKSNALTVQPKMGDALLFFPADKDGNFDDRLEHEGCQAIDTKWIARIWRHIDRVPPPFGLTIAALSKLK